MGILHKCYRNSASQTLAVVLIGAIHKLIGTWKKRVNKYICLTEFQKNGLNIARFLKELVIIHGSKNCL